MERSWAERFEVPCTNKILGLTFLESRMKTLQTVSIMPDGELSPISFTSYLYCQLKGEHIPHKTATGLWGFFASLYICIPQKVSFKLLQCGQTWEPVSNAKRLVCREEIQSIWDDSKGQSKDWQGDLRGGFQLCTWNTSVTGAAGQSEGQASEIGRSLLRKGKQNISPLLPDWSS